MSWKQGAEVEQRVYLIEEVLQKLRSTSQVCAELGISRKTAYKWLTRYREEGGQALGDRSRRPLFQARQLPPEFLARLVQLRSKYPTWGPKKLRQKLLNARGRPACSASTLSRWLKRLGLVRSRHRRVYYPVPTLSKGLSVAYAANQVWTVDFKGWFYTGDRVRADPLTVRDLYSRYGIAIELLAGVDEGSVRVAFEGIFIRFGLPKIIRVDNGKPFAAEGPYGYSALSLWWTRLGIEVQFTRPSRPCDNGSHEQFHRVYKAETLQPAALHRAAQQQRSNQWLIHYNEQRPHEALGQIVPARRYQKSRRKYRPISDDCSYPKAWQTIRASKKGYITWNRRQRLISRTVAGLKIALKPSEFECVHVYVGDILLGTLHQHDRKGMRAAKKVPVTALSPM